MTNPQTTNKDTDLQLTSPIEVRRTTPSDVSEILSFTSGDTQVLKKRFGSAVVNSYDEMIECGFFSLSAFDENGDMVGLLTIGQDEQPLYVDTEREPMRTEQVRIEKKINDTNSYWLHFLHVEPLIQDYVMKELFDEFFVLFPECDWILYRGDDSFHAIKNYFEKVESSDDNSLYLLNRNTFVKKLKIRLGRVEDNDDLTPLLPLPNLTTLTDWKETFWLSTQLHNQNEEKQVLVGEIDGEVVGVMYAVVCEKDAADLMTTYKLIDFDGFISDFDTQTEGVILNAFEITMFFIKEEYKDRSLDFIRQAFEMFPKCEYGCVFLPYSESAHPILKNFVIAETNDNVECHEALHLVSRVAFFDQLSVTEAFEDEKDLLLEFIPNDKEFYNNIISSFKGDDLQTIAMKNQQEKLIGVAVVKIGFETFDLRNNYNLDTYVNMKHYKEDRLMEVLSVHILPKYKRKAPFFLRQLMKVMRKNIMLYGNETVNPFINKEFICLTPRRAIETVNGIRTYPLKKHPVFFLTERLTSEPKLEIHARIVVIGASKTGLSFIETLAMIPYVYFTNIIMISSDGLTKTEKSEAFFVENCTELQKNTQMILLNRPNIRVFSDKLHSIQRKESRILCTSEQTVPYEYLILAASRLYQLSQAHKDGHKQELEEDKEDSDQPDVEETEIKSSDDISDDEYIPNKGFTFPTVGIMDLRNELDFFSSLQEHIDTVVNDEGDEISRVVVYGSTFDAFSTAQGLVQQCNVPAHKITLVCPNHSNDLFEDRTLEKELNKIYDSLQVQKYDRYIVESFGGNDEGQLTHIVISNAPQLKKKRSLKKLIEIPCSLFINCHETNVDKNLLVTFSKMSLVFDGRLIVDPQFRTTDPFVYSAGPLAKFSRRFGLSESMELSNAHELGEKMAYCVLHSLGVPEFYDQIIEPELTLIQKIPPFTTNVIHRGQFLGGNEFFRCRTRHCKLDQCQVLMTSNVLPGGKLRYTRILVDKYSGIISEITTLGDERLEQNNLASLVGIPATYCNSMILRYQEGLIDDLISFLRENWAVALYCDLFKDFRTHLFDTTKLFDTVFNFANTELEKVKSGEYKHISECELKMRENTPPELRLFLETELGKFLLENQNLNKLIPSEVYEVPQ